MEPQAFVDMMTQKFRELWPELHIEPDQFIRTTEERHKQIVQQILQQIYDNGEIFLKGARGKARMSVRPGRAQRIPTTSPPKRSEG